MTTFNKQDVDNILRQIGQPNSTHTEMSTMDTSADIYQEIAIMLQTHRGGIGTGLEKLQLLSSGKIVPEEFSNIFIGAVLD
jgi:hypothetical protein